MSIGDPGKSHKGGSGALSKKSNDSKQCKISKNQNKRKTPRVGKTSSTFKSVPKL